MVGRYLLTPEIFDKLEKTGRGAGGEIQLTDGIADLLEEKPVYAYSFSGVRYDCGSKLGYLQATVAYGLEHADTGDSFREGHQFPAELDAFSSTVRVTGNTLNVDVSVVILRARTEHRCMSVSSVKTLVYR